jgi:hypothetical protein
MTKGMESQNSEPQATTMLDFVHRNSISEAKDIIRRSSLRIRSARISPEIPKSSAHEIQVAGVQRDVEAQENVEQLE